MSDYKDFTVDQQNFGDLGEYLKDLKTTNKIKFIPIIDAGIAQRNEKVEEYSAYDTGVEMDVFIKSGASNFYNYQVRQFTGQDWAGDSAYVNFRADNATLYWTT
jgi:alpha-glucosidase (family GH31 glycosyl hydrolase)|tara:strand:+ start:4259 stop:4570 length:312 start_codon:yes stop_codon:yes gene_type:complete